MVDVNQDEKKRAKLEVRIGKLEFSGEGEEAWLAEQLRAIIAAVPNVPDGDSPQENEPEFETRSEKSTISLAAHIRAKGAEHNQTLRFLVTADWLRLRGSPVLTSAAIARALSENHQARLANPADCLNKNVSKGLCEKGKDGFFITPEGLKELGYK